MNAMGESPGLLIQPFAGLCPRPQWAAEVAAPPYDVVDSQEARRLVQGNPHSFFHVSKAEIDLPPGTPVHDPAVYDQAAKNFLAMQKHGILVREETPALYLYRLIMGERSQTGVVAAVAVDAYLQGRVKRHEHTRPDKEEDRTRFNQALGANSGPVFLVHRVHAGIRAAVAAGMSAEPRYDFVAGDGVRHTLWPVKDPQAIGQLVEGFESMAALYIADGHHRSAAAARLCLRRREENPGFTGLEPWNRFLAVIFPEDEVRILDYNRVVRDLHGLTVPDFLEKVGERFHLTPWPESYRPEGPWHFGMFLEEKWWRLVLKEAYAREEDPVLRLDVSLLDRHLLSPILGIHDPRRDARIDFVGGIRGLEGLMDKARSSGMAVAFSLYPPTLADMMAVADAGEVMPPKSTWFEPKLRDGLVIQMV